MGIETDPEPFRPVLRGVLLTGGLPRYLRSDISGAVGDDSTISGEALWWPPEKLAGRYLGPYVSSQVGKAADVMPQGVPGTLSRRRSTPMHPASGRVLATSRRKARADEMPDAPLILCYDGSEDAKHAIRRGGELLTLRRALVLTVWLPTAALGPGLGFTASTVNLVELDRAAAEAGASIAEEGARIGHDAGLDAEPIAVKADGPVWHTIVETADRHDAAAIVMGSRGLTGLRSMLLGSVSGGVVHHADRPALVIRRPREDDSRAA